jgi:hypothetical protein
MFFVNILRCFVSNVLYLLMQIVYLIIGTSELLFYSEKMKIVYLIPKL